MPISCLLWVSGYIYPNEHKTSPIEMNYSRYTVQIFLQTALIMMTSRSFDLTRPKDFKIIVTRAIISSVNGLFTAFFQMYLPLPVFYTLSSSSIIFVFMFNHFLYHTPVTATQAKAVAVAILGLILVINGRYVYSLSLIHI